MYFKYIQRIRSEVSLDCLFANKDGIEFPNDMLAHKNGVKHPIEGPMRPKYALAHSVKESCELNYFSEKETDS